MNLDELNSDRNDHRISREPLRKNSQMMSLVSTETENLRNRGHGGHYYDKFGVKPNPFIKRELSKFIWKSQSSSGCDDSV